MQERFSVPVGLLDHTLDNTTSIASVALGGCIIEKHVTLDRSGGGPDVSFSLESAELKALCDGIKTAWQALGEIDYGRKSSEEGNVKFRRSLYFVKDMRVGDIITPSCIRSIRPGYGLAPKYYGEIIGRKLGQDIVRGVPVNFALLNDKIK